MAGRDWWYTLGYIPLGAYAGTGALTLDVTFHCDGPDDVFFDHSQVVVEALPGLPEWNGWYAGDTHWHSDLTNSMNYDAFAILRDVFGENVGAMAQYIVGEFGTPLAIASVLADAVGLDWLAITDHSYELDGSNDGPGGPEPDYWRDLADFSDAGQILGSNSDYGWGTLESSLVWDEFLFLKGEEVSVDGDNRNPDDVPLIEWVDAVAKQYHLLAYDFGDGDGLIASPGYDVAGVQDMRPLDEIMEEICNSGLFAYAAHPMLDNFFGEPWGDPVANDIGAAGEALDEAFADAFRGFEFWNGRFDGDRDSSLALWEDVLAQMIMSPTDGPDKDHYWFLSGGSDEHMLAWAGFGGHLGGDGNIGDVRTIVAVDAPPGVSPTQAEVLTALKDGRSIVTDGPWFTMGVDRGDATSGTPNGSIMDFGTDIMVGGHLLVETAQDRLLFFDWPGQTNTDWGTRRPGDGGININDIKLIRYGPEGNRAGEFSVDDFLYDTDSGKWAFNAYDAWLADDGDSGWNAFRAELFVDFDGDGVHETGDYRAYTNPIWLYFEAPDIDVELPGRPDDVHAYDFGGVEVGQNASATFTVRNEGGATLTVTQASGLAAPFAVSPANGSGSADDWSIPAGGTRTFTVTFTPGAVTGYSDTLMLSSDDPDEGSYPIALSGSGLSEGVWQPYVPSQEETEILVATDASGTRAGVTITFPDAGYRVSDWGTAVRAGNTFVADAQVEDWSGVSAQVVTTLSHEYGLGALAPDDYTFVFKAWGIEVERQSFQISIGPEIEITDDSGGATDKVVTLPDTPLGATSSAKVFTLSNVGDQALDVTSLAVGGANPGDFEVTVRDDAGAVVTTTSFSIPAGKSYTVTVRFGPTAIGPRSANITFNTNDPDDGENLITLSMAGEGLPLDTMSPVVVGVELNDRAGRTVSDIEPSGIGVRTIEVTFSEAVFFDPAAVHLRAVEFSTGAEVETPGVLPAVAVTGSGTNVMTIVLGAPAGTVGAVDTWVKVT
ncbi:MAG: choice-of-anchor D domain-containing protein, partial [Chloroflexi bacterium]|nr:choice-of-anchor D domain-containing protein [Chloroflexota bacterium]